MRSLLFLLLITTIPAFAGVDDLTEKAFDFLLRLPSSPYGARTVCIFDSGAMFGEIPQRRIGNHIEKKKLATSNLREYPLFRIDDYDSRYYMSQDFMLNAVDKDAFYKGIKVLRAVGEHIIFWLPGGRMGDVKARTCVTEFTPSPQLNPRLIESK